MPSDIHKSRRRRSSTSRTIWLLRKSLRISYSKVPALSIAPPRYLTRTAARSLALRARGLIAASASPAITGCLVSTLMTASSPRASPADKRIELIQLAVDPDAQRLEGARRRIDPLPAAGGHAAPHNLRQPP